MYGGISKYEDCNYWIQRMRQIHAGRLFKRKIPYSRSILRLCLCRAVKRYVRYRGKTRESMTEDCPEKLDLEFIWWILYAGRTREYKKRYRNVLKRYASKTIVIKNQRQLTAFTNNNSSISRKMCLKQRRNHE